MRVEFMIDRISASRFGDVVVLLLQEQTGATAEIEMDADEALSLARYLPPDGRYTYAPAFHIKPKGEKTGMLNMPRAHVFPSPDSAFQALLRDPRWGIEMYISAKRPLEAARVIWKAVRGEADTHNT